MANHVKGIDISRWQGTNINWNAVKNAGYKFVFIKLTDGHSYKKAFIDMARIQANGAVTVGLKIGYYHYSHPTEIPSLATDSNKEASFFLNTLANNFPTPNFPLVLDFEDDGNLLSQSKNEEWIQIFINKLAQSGHETILYSYRSYFNSHLNSNHILGINPLWHAYYPRVFDPNASITLPRGFSDWKIWQYTDSGAVAGYNGPLDLNLMKKSFYDLY